MLIFDLKSVLASFDFFVFFFLSEALASLDIFSLSFFLFGAFASLDLFLSLFFLSEELASLDSLFSFFLFLLSEALRLIYFLHNFPFQGNDTLLRSNRGDFFGEWVSADCGGRGVFGVSACGGLRGSD